MTLFGGALAGEGREGHPCPLPLGEWLDGLYTASVCCLIGDLLLLLLLLSVGCLLTPSVCHFVRCHVMLCELSRILFEDEHDPNVEREGVNSPGGDSRDAVQPIEGLCDKSDVNMMIRTGYRTMRDGMEGGTTQRAGT